MALSAKERDERRREKGRALQEEELRMRARPGTRQVLRDLMDWAGISEQGEAMTLALHRIHELGRERALHFLTPPRHEYVIPENVARKLELAYQREALRICHDE